MKRVITAMAVGLFLVFALSIKIAQSKGLPADCKKAIQTITQIKARIKTAINPGGNEFVSKLLENEKIAEIGNFAKYLKEKVGLTGLPPCYEGKCKVFRNETQLIIDAYNKLPHKKSTQKLARSNARYIQNILKLELQKESPYPKILVNGVYAVDVTQQYYALIEFKGLVAKHSGLINATIGWFSGISKCAEDETDSRICTATYDWLTKFSLPSAQVITRENNKYELEKALSKLYAQHIEAISQPDTSPYWYSSCFPNYGRREVSNVTMIDYYRPLVTKTYNETRWENDGQGGGGWGVNTIDTVLHYQNWELPFEGDFNITEVQRAADGMAATHINIGYIDPDSAVPEVRNTVAQNHVGYGEYKNSIYPVCKQRFTNAITEINNVLQSAYNNKTIVNLFGITPIDETGRIDNYTESDPYNSPFDHSYRSLTYYEIPEAIYTYNPSD